ncbi:hypothetical protein E2C01_019912 [Portunus trituberculatus]|uniref:Uncharacterized protein n=1 Tax=Portunus trituberculatus TaxID=210409 RepID=A0A5B7DZX3_PORTR|nr:hypothetical protein [Portunus trituberculatus]
MVNSTNPMPIKHHFMLGISGNFRVLVMEGGVEGMEREGPCVMQPAMPGPPIKLPAIVGAASMNRSCFWSRYCAHTGDFSSRAVTCTIHIGKEKWYHISLEALINKGCCCYLTSGE